MAVDDSECEELMIAQEQREQSPSVVRVRAAAAGLGIILLVVGVLALAGLGTTTSATYRHARRGAEAASTSALAPEENLHDANPCAQYEEYFWGMCYTQCSILTKKQNKTGFDLRTTPWTCCKEPCDIKTPWEIEFVHNIGWCTGYAVAGEHGEVCPHKVGSCLVNEEFLYGKCYKSCSILTNGAYPHRFGFATCCNATSEFGAALACLNPMNDQTNVNFNVGGGAGDNDDSTPAEPHDPILALDEAR
jgi:hypothetical protein